MKKIFLFALSAMMLSMISCSKDSDEEDDEDDDPYVFMGTVTFYITKKAECGDNITVYLQTEDLTKIYKGEISSTNITTETPSCGMTTGYTFKDVKYGKYKFNTSCGIRHINGNINVNKECTIQSID